MQRANGAVDIKARSGQLQVIIGLDEAANVVMLLDPRGAKDLARVLEEAADKAIEMASEE